MKISRILYPTDFSGGSANAAPYAISLAQKYGAELHLLHVIYDISSDTGWIGSQLDMEGIYAEVKKSAEAELERIAQQELAGADNITQAVRIGKPFDEIAAYVKDNNIDLIVMGTHGRKGIGRVLFGSTAQRVVKRAACPVLTVGEQKQA